MVILVRSDQILKKERMRERKLSGKLQKLSEKHSVSAHHSLSHHIIFFLPNASSRKRKREREKKGFHNLLIILQDVCPYLGFRKSWNSFRWDTSGLVTSSCSGLTQRRLVLDFLWLMICWGTLTRCTVILPIRHTSTDGSGLKRIKYVPSLQR